MRDRSAFDKEDLWFPAHMSAGDSFSRPLAADGAATAMATAGATASTFGTTAGAGIEDDGIGLPRRRPATGTGTRRRGPKAGGVKASSWLWLTLWGAAALGIAAYAARKEIAIEMTQGWLKGQGVPAQLRFDRLSLGHASGSFVLGNPNHPDLSAGRFDADFSLNPFASGGQPLARLKHLRLDQVGVHLSYRGGKLSFGTLDRMMRTLSERPPADVTIDHAAVVADSDYGALHGNGSVALHDGRLSYLSLKLPAGRLDGTQGGGDFGGGDILVRGASDNELQVEARLNAAQLDLRDGSHVVEGAPARPIQAQGLSLEVSGQVPCRDDGALSGPLDAVVAVSLRGLRAQGVAVDGADYRLKLDGRLRDGAQYDGAADVSLHADHVAGRGIDARRVVVEADGLDTHTAAGSVSLKGAIRATVGRVSRSGAVATAVRLKADRFAWSGDASGSHAEFSGAIAAGRASAGDLSLNNAALAVTGAMDGDAASDAWRLKVQGDLDSGGSFSGLDGLARGRMASDDLARLDRGLGDFKLHASGLRLAMDGQGDGPGDIDLRLTAPAEARLAGGLTLDLTPRDGQPLVASHAAGAFDLMLTGGPRAALDLSGLSLSPRGALAGDYSLDSTFSLAPVTGAHVTARGHFSTAGGLAASVSQPLVFSAQSADLGETFTHLSGTLNQDGDALLRIDGSGWRLNGAFKTLSLDVPEAHLALTGGRGSLAAADGLKIGLDTATLSDALPGAEARFRPLLLSGTLTRDTRILTGRFTAATPNALTAGKPTPVLVLTLDGDLATGRGQFALRTPGLTFTPGGLQPADLSALFPATQVSGTLGFDGAFRWAGGKRSSSGVLRLDGLSFAGAMGTAGNLRGDIDFTSLAPLRSAPSRVLGIYSIDAGRPLGDLAMTLRVQDDHIAVDAASLDTPGGAVRLEPMQVAFDPAVPFSGAAVFDGLDFGKIIAASHLADSLTFEGKLRGRVPFSILGGHVTFAGGWMTAEGPGHISIKRQAITRLAAAGSLTTGGEPAAAVPPGANPFRDLAYQAMEDLSYDQLDATIQSRPGEGADALFHLKGRFAPPAPRKPRVSLRDYLDGAWAQKPLALPSDTPVDLYLDVPFDSGAGRAAQPAR